MILFFWEIPTKNFDENCVSGLRRPPRLRLEKIRLKVHIFTVHETDEADHFLSILSKVSFPSMFPPPPTACLFGLDLVLLDRLELELDRLRLDLAP